MKKLITLIVILLILGGAAYFIFGLPGVSRLQPEAVLPEDALVYIHLEDVSGALEALKAMPLWQALGKINYKEISQTAQEPQLDLFIQQFKNWTHNPQTKQVFDTFFSKEVAVGLYPGNGDLNKLDLNAIDNLPQFLDTMVPNVYIVARVAADVQVAELASRAVSKFGDNMQKTSVNYKNYAIQILTEPKSQLHMAYVRIKDLLIIATSKEAIQKSIDAFLKATPALKDNPSLKNALASADSKAHLQTFWNMKQTFGLFENTARKALAQAGSNVQDQKAVEDYFNVMRAFDYMGSSATWGALTKVRTSIHYDAGKLSAQARPHYADCRSLENRSLVFVPNNVLLYEWGACLDLKAYWDKGMEELHAKNGAAAQQTIAAYEQSLGMSIEDDLIPAFGDEWGGYLEDITQLGNFPLPSFALFVEAKDPGKIITLMDKLTRNPMFKLQEEPYEGITIHYFVSPVQSIQPGYCFIGKYFVLALNKSLLKNSIDASKDKNKSLAANAHFKAVNFGLTDKNVGMVFADVGRFVTKTQSILDWSKQWMAQKDEQRAALKAGTQQRLEDVQQSREDARQELSQVKTDITNVGDEVWDLENQKQDATAKKKELADLKAKQSALEADIANLSEQIGKLKNTIANYDEDHFSPEQREVYFKDVVNPLLEALKTIESLGGFTAISQDTINSGLFIQM